MKYIIFLFALSNVLRAGQIEIAVERFYNELRALDIRGTLDEKKIERVLPSVTPSLRQAFRESQATIKAWEIAARDRPEASRDLKPPPNEGPLFTGVWEGGRFVSISSVAEAGDRAYVLVTIIDERDPKSVGWTDFLIFHRVESAWLIDDIVFSPDDKTPTTVRESIQYQQPPKA